MTNLWAWEYIISCPINITLTSVSDYVFILLSCCATCCTTLSAVVNVGVTGNVGRLTTSKGTANVGCHCCQTLLSPQETDCIPPSNPCPHPISWSPMANRIGSSSEEKPSIPIFYCHALMDPIIILPHPTSWLLYIVV